MSFMPFFFADNIMSAEKCSFVRCGKFINDVWFECQKCKGKFCDECGKSNNGKCWCIDA